MPKSEKTFTSTELLFLHYLKESLKSEQMEQISAFSSTKEIKEVLSLAIHHEVLPLISDLLSDKIPDETQMILFEDVARTVQKAIKLQELNGVLTQQLKKQEITAITLKGIAVARFYPVPEYRKTTDMDLFLSNQKEIKNAVDILGKNGFQLSEDWHANHHLVLTNDEGETVELHKTWAEEFKEKQLNQYLRKIERHSLEHCQLYSWQGVPFYAYEPAWQGFYLMIHMLQHFVGSGFGIRNLCDWVVLWNSCDQKGERKLFWFMAKESGTSQFSSALTKICIEYLGLEEEKSPVPVEELQDEKTADKLLRDILDAGEFGYSEKERMVGMKGNSVLAYVQEFHHQMHINFPNAGKYFVLWPVLWGFTLLRFFKNNKKLNRAPVHEIMKKAGERGRLVQNLTKK